MARYVDELGKRTGLTFSLEYYPLERARLELKAGRLDGDMGRTIYAYDEGDPVIYTSHPVIINQLYFVSEDSSIDPLNRETWKNLKLAALRDGKDILNWIGTAGIPLNSIFWVKNFEILRLSLLMGRAEYTILNRTVYNSWLDDPDFLASEIRMIEPAVLSIINYIVFAEKHEVLVPGISRAMKEMSESGLTESIFDSQNLLCE